MYLEDVHQNMSKFNTISLYCGNYSGQNKKLFIMLHTFLKKSRNINKIFLNYLFAGYTYMPADSVHSTIDSFISKKIIYAPSQWPTVISFARHAPKPYKVLSLSHTDFNDWVSFEGEFKCIPNVSVPSTAEPQEIAY